MGEAALTNDDALSPPVRRAYRHVGRIVPPNLRELTDEEKLKYPIEEYGYVRFEEFGPDKAPLSGTFWKQDKLDRIHKGCGQVTIISVQDAEYLIPVPTSYRRMRCAHCSDYFRAGEQGEFVWDGTDIRVGT